MWLRQNAIHSFGFDWFWTFGSLVPRFFFRLVFGELGDSKLEWWQRLTTTHIANKFCVKRRKRSM